MKKSESENIYRKRFNRHFEELRWLYMELYDNGSMFAELCDRMKTFFDERSAALKKSDRAREQDPGWYKGNDLMGMMLYIDNFAGNMKGVKEKLDYIEACQVNYIHLMPFLDTTEGKSDGGYAVSDFRKVQEKLGTMEDLEELTGACHKKGINVCMDFVMNHTSEDHEWAKRARAGEGEYMSRYFFFDNWDIPARYERTVPQVFPTTAPGNFTWLPDIQHFVMTCFYPYQWDLNYRNPRVFNEMMYNFLYLANRGIDIIRIDAVPYIWKELNTSCRNLPQVHTIVRLMRMISEIVCPGILLLGEVVMEPAKVVPYFGTLEKPECHMLYNVTTMATTWHTVATRDVRLLKRQLDIIGALPREYVFQNYLRCHDDIGWGLDYGFLWEQGMGERPHKQYLNDYFQGFAGNSVSRGELYNSDPVSGDARFCGTTASMCGIEKALEEQNWEALERAIRFDVTLHAYMFMQSGIPVLYSGDEIAALNDYSYKEDPNKVEDSRYIHRGKLNWDLAAAALQAGQAADDAKKQGKKSRGKALKTVEEEIGAEAKKALEGGNSAKEEGAVLTEPGVEAAGSAGTETPAPLHKYITAEYAAGKVFTQLLKLEQIRRSEKAFVSYADMWTIETWDQGLLCIGRQYEGEKIVGIFNFTEHDRTAWINEEDGLYTDLLTGKEREAKGVYMPAYGFCYLKRE